MFTAWGEMDQSMMGQDGPCDPSCPNDLCYYYFIWHEVSFTAI